jgi:hypothetical protein
VSPHFAGLHLATRRGDVGRVGETQSRESAWSLYRSRISLSPASTCAMSFGGILPTHLGQALYSSLDATVMHQAQPRWWMARGDFARATQQELLLRG